MTLAEIVGVLALASAAWFVWDSLKVRENANRAMRAACAAEGWLFLDDTVALSSLRPMRNAHGHVVLRRVYDFEYSGTGHDRRRGTITMIADEVSVLHIDPRTPPEVHTLH